MASSMSLQHVLLMASNHNNYVCFCDSCFATLEALHQHVSPLRAVCSPTEHGPIALVVGGSVDGAPLCAVAQALQGTIA